MFFGDRLKSKIIFCFMFVLVGLLLLGCPIPESEKDDSALEIAEMEEDALTNAEPTDLSHQNAVANQQQANIPAEVEIN